MSIYAVGVTTRTTPEHPKGVPCILMDRDSVLCEFPGSRGTEQAEVVCKILNGIWEDRAELFRRCS